jgi:hypothetical protein
MNESEVLSQSLERAAEIGGDPTAAVYARYFSLCTESGELMSHVDLHMQGRMLTEVMRLLMAEDPATDESYLKFETGNHTGYGVKPHMYANLFQAVRDTVSDTLAAEWTPTYAAAWDQRIATLLEQIDSATAAAR